MSKIILNYTFVYINFLFKTSYYSIKKYLYIHPNWTIVIKNPKYLNFIMKKGY